MSYISQKFVKAISPNLPVLNTARVAVIFGNINPAIVFQMAHNTSDLYRQGRVKKIIVTGGAKIKGSTQTEAGFSRSILLSRGVPGKHILLENHSLNSFENVRNARKILLKSEGNLKREPIIFTGMDYAGRRFLMTISKTWPEATPSFIGADSFKTQKSQWHTDPEIVDLLENDKKKWPEYIGNGHIKPVRIRRITWDIHKANKIRKLKI